MTKLIHTSLKVLALCASLLMAGRANSATIQVTANMTGVNNWYNTNEYVLNGFIYVLEGGLLNIEPGTVIRGKAGTGLSSAALFITRGAKINAAGTAHSPIVFTSETDDLEDPTDIPLYSRNLWGGIVLFGKSVLNTASDATGNGASPKYDLFEGLPNTIISGQQINAFGGNDDNDNSGVLRYCSIRYSSTVILPNKEINALSLCAVGRGTTIENIECFAAGDDSVEFFGGTVNTKYMASIFCDDDNFDIDMGYRGKNQFWFAIQAPDRKDNGGEWNGEPSGIAVNAAPIGNFEIYNATYIGAGTNSTGARAFLAREYAAPKIFNSIFTEFNVGANIDDRSGLHFTNGLAKFQHNLLWNFAANGVTAPYGQNANALWVLTNAANSNMFMDPILRSVSRTNIPAFRLDPRPSAGSPALSSSLTAPDDGFYTPVAYKGAFKDVNWAADWGFAAEACLMSGVGAGVPLAPCSTGPVCIATTLAIVKNGANVDVTFASVPGATYRLIGSSSVTAARGTWSTLSTLTATGTTSTLSAAASAAQQFLVVVCQ